MSVLDNPPVRRVRDALAAAGLGDPVIELAETARSAEDAAAAVGCELGAIVKSLVFMIGNRAVMVLVAGDHRCIEANLARCLDLEGRVRRPAASEVKGLTGFTIGGVAPIGLAHPLPMAMDRSLKRFDTLYAAAGHPHAVFPVAFDDLRRLSGAIVSWNVAEPMEGADAGPAPLERSKTFPRRSEGDGSG